MVRVAVAGFDMSRRLVFVTVAIVLLGVAKGCATVTANPSFDRAVTAFEAGDFKTAVALLEESLRRGPDSARARTLLGWSLYKMGALGPAKTEFDRALRLDANEPNAFYAHEGLGWIAYRAGDLDTALAAFAEALRRSPGYHNAHDGLGWTYLAKRDFVRAEASFRAAQARVPDDRDALRGLGFVAYHRGQWQVAIDRFREVLRREEGDTLARSALGWSYYYKRDLAAARTTFHDLARREPTWADPLVGLAWIAESEGPRDVAKTAFWSAVDASAMYLATGEPGANLRRLLLEREDWADLWRHLAWTLYHQRAFPEAEAEFRALLARRANDADGLRGLGFTLYAVKRYRDAIPVLERAIATKQSLPSVRERVEIPGVPGLHTIVSDATSTLAWSHHHAGDIATALRLFREVTARNPDWADSQSGLGWALLRGGNRVEAERAFRRSLQAQPGYPDALVGLQTLGARTP